MQKVVLLTGGSKGIGYATAKSFVEKGCKIYELSRHEVSNPGVVHITGDVTDKASVDAAVNQIIEREGRIDILVCNAGTILSGAIEFIDEAEVRKLLDLNFFGVIHCVRAVLPHMRKAGGGRIVCLSSMAGPFPIPFQAYYSVSKAGISTFTSALASEVREFGISVCALMPGDTNSDQVRYKFHDGDEIYGGRIERSVGKMEYDEKHGMRTATVGNIISNIALKKHVKPSYSIGLLYKIGMFVKHLLPECLFIKLIRVMYAK